MQAASASLEILPTPAGSDSSLSRVVTDERDQVYLSWVEQQADFSQLKYSMLEAETWSAPEIISEGKDWFINWADFPSLMVNTDNRVAHWLTQSPQRSYEYDIKASFYDDQAKRWGKAVTINKDGLSAVHGFVSMLPMQDGQSLIAWLDGRETARDAQAAKTLRAGLFDRDGATLSEWALDLSVCDCCQTSAAMTPAGPVVVYRNRTEQEIRDIYIIRYLDGAWSEPSPIHDDGWEIAGCPVNGPAVAASGANLAVAWFTAEGNIPRVQLVLSSDSGKSFGTPILVANRQTIGRVDTAILASGKVVVSWIDTRDSYAKIILTLYSPGGELLVTTEVAASKASRRSGFPVMTSVGESVYLTWTDISDSEQVQVARVSYND